MPNISLPTGKVIYMSTFDWLFVLEEKDVHDFYQSCVADDLGKFVDDPFSQRINQGKLEVDETPDIEEIPIEEEDYE